MGWVRMSMQPKGSGEIPAETVRVARAAFPKGSLAIRGRDELGPLFTDEEFADLFRRGASLSGHRGGCRWCSCCSSSGA
ncbi:hypothetical protein GCM10020367_72600 [Streptomyces sannanensis]|uniref:DUF397 domain-containing protein n=1 Tax=Streptomyces sannanensis TaxID=285536 RepID=A0ABP6SP74_9ACTN